MFCYELVSIDFFIPLISPPTPEHKPTQLTLSPGLIFLHHHWYQHHKLHLTSHPSLYTGVHPLSLPRGHCNTIRYMWILDLQLSLGRVCGYKTHEKIATDLEWPNYCYHQDNSKRRLYLGKNAAQIDKKNQKLVVNSYKDIITKKKIHFWNTASAVQKLLRHS